MDIPLGSQVRIPSGGYGILRYKGSVEGKAGIFAGVELVGDSKGKNSGDFAGKRYFSTSRPNTGLFLPLAKLQRSPVSKLPPTTPLREIENFYKGSPRENVDVQKLQSDLKKSQDDSELLRMELASRDSKLLKLKKGFEQQRQEFLDVIESLERQAAESAKMYELELARFQAQIDKLQRQNGAIEQLESRVEDMASTLETERQQLFEKDKALESKSKELTKVSKELESTKSEASRLSSEVMELQKKLTKQNHGRNYEDELKTNERTINQLTQKNRILQEKLKEQESSHKEVTRLKQKMSQMFTKDAMDIIKHQRDAMEREKNELQMKLASLERKSSFNAAVPSLTNSSVSSISPAGSPTMGRKSQVVDGQLRVYIPFEPVDASAGRVKWCGLCERNGHDSEDCPYEYDMF